MYTLYNNLFKNIYEEFPNIKTICHGYDYAVPSNGKWLGKPLIDRGIVNQHLQFDILRLLMDKFNDILEELSQKYQNVTYVDLRNTIDSASGWHNELHPDNNNFEKVSSKIEDAIRRVTG